MYVYSILQCNRTKHTTLKPYYPYYNEKYSYNPFIHFLTSRSEYLSSRLLTIALPSIPFIIPSADSVFKPHIPTHFRLFQSLENSVRGLAEDHGLTLDVWTGTHGILEVPGRRQVPVKVYLGLSANKETVPVPAYMWKVRTTGLVCGGGVDWLLLQGWVVL